MQSSLPLVHRIARVVLSTLGVAAVTWLLHFVVPQNATTAGFAYLLLVLIIATSWGFVEAVAASLLATVVFNYYFLPPIGTFTIADPKNWVALASFLTTSLLAGRLSAKAEHRAAEALERQHDVERLYTFSRAILLIGPGEPFAKQLITTLAEGFGFTAAVLYDRKSEAVYRAGPQEFDAMEEQLREAAMQGTSYSDAAGTRVITSVRLGSEPIASLGLQGARMNDAMVQGIANLVAIGLERARAQEMAHQIEAARQSEQLRTTLIDAMAHEFKTPLTSIKAATTTLLSNPDQGPETRTELLRVADEEADRLRDLIDNSVDMARVDMEQIDIQPESTDLGDMVGDVLTSLHAEFAERRVMVEGRELELRAALDRRLVRLALRQVLGNALKYSGSETPITIRLSPVGDGAAIDVVDHGPGIVPAEQERIFERFYRSPAIRRQVPGTGLGLSIARNIMRAHRGDLTVSSSPGETTFRMLFPATGRGASL